MIATYAGIMTAESQALAESWRPGQKVIVQKAMIELTLTTIARSMFAGSLPKDVVHEIIRLLPIFTYGMVARTVLPDWLCKISGFNRRFFGAIEVYHLRNRVAHHEPLRPSDALANYESILILAEYIDPDARRWLESISRVGPALASRPGFPPPPASLEAHARKTRRELH